MILAGAARAAASAVVRSPRPSPAPGAFPHRRLFLVNVRSHLRVPDANGYSHAEASMGTGEGHYRQPADELGIRRRLCRRGRSAALGPRPRPRRGTSLGVARHGLRAAPARRLRGREGRRGDRHGLRRVRNPSAARHAPGRGAHHGRFGAGAPAVRPAGLPRLRLRQQPGPLHPGPRPGCAAPARGRGLRPRLLRRGPAGVPRLLHRVAAAAALRRRGGLRGGLRERPYGRLGAAAVGGAAAAGAAAHGAREPGDGHLAAAGRRRAAVRGQAVTAAAGTGRAGGTRRVRAPQTRLPRHRVRCRGSRED
ncbi:hypothetical protein SGPA1_12002 [Streptomyces misionensis JCM 4497]